MPWHGRSTPVTQNTVSSGDARATESEGTPYIEPSFLNSLPYYLPLAVFPLLFVALLYGGWWMVAPFLFMSLAGSLDKVVGLDGENMNPKGTPERRLFSYNVPVWAWAFLWPPTLVFGLWQILYVDAFAIWEDVILAILLTMEAQAVFVVGHEMVHRRTMWERRVGEFLLASASYPQYATEHVYIHHAKVGTPHDDGSAQKGKSFWRYFPREVASNLTNSWKVSGERLARRQLSRWHYSNPFWRYCLFVAFWYALVLLMGGIWALPVYVFLGLSCVFSMKISNYFQHYGLRRILLANGRWEKISPHHSWSADWKFTNWMFFKMQRHADHHAMATRPYPQLQAREGESPELPGTYGEMMNLALRPKKWFAKMDPIVDQWREQLHPDIEDWSPYDSSVCAARPDSFEDIVEIFGVAPRLAKWVERHPELLDNLKAQEFTDLDLPKGFLSDQNYETIARRGLARLYWTHEMGVQEMQDLIEELPSTHAKETAEIIRNWSNDKAFQIGIHTVRQNLSPDESRIAMSNLAEACIASLIEDVVADVVERVGTRSEGGVAVVLLGDLASQEVCSDSAIELMLVHDGWSTKQSDRLWRRFRETLEHLASDSLLFSPIPRDANDFFSVETSNVAEHCQSSPLRDRPILARSRCIYEYGEMSIGDRFSEIRLDVLKTYSENESLIAKLAERNGGTRELQNSAFVDMPGGLEEVENAARFMQLTADGHSADDTAPSAAQVFRHNGLAPLEEAALMWRNLQGISRLVHEVDFDMNNARPKVKSIVAGACGTEDFEALQSLIAATAQKAEAEIRSFAERTQV